jgi:hydrogenase/urease accessory protein HupE
MEIADRFAESAEKDSLPYRLCLLYLYAFSAAGAVFIVDYTGIELPYHQYALGVAFLLGYLLATVAIAYVINAEYAHWNQLEE